jgi:hypothetical protein
MHIDCTRLPDKKGIDHPPLGPADCFARRLDVRPRFPTRKYGIGATLEMRIWWQPIVFFRIANAPSHVRNNANESSSDDYPVSYYRPDEYCDQEVREGCHKEQIATVFPSHGLQKQAPDKAPGALNEF